MKYSRLKIRKDKLRNPSVPIWMSRPILHPISSLKTETEASKSFSQSNSQRWLVINSLECEFSEPPSFYRRERFPSFALISVTQTKKGSQDLFCQIKKSIFCVLLFRLDLVKSPLDSVYHLRITFSPKDPSNSIIYSFKKMGYNLQRKG